MANALELKTRMNSIQDTRKITNAMYLISSSKLKRARARLEATEPYFYALQNSIARLLRHAPKIRHPYLDRVCATGQEPRRAYLVITADKGLAGGFNHNVLKLAEEQMKETKEKRLFVVGQIGQNYFRRKGIAYDTHFQYTIQKPTIHRARVIAETLLELYRQEKVDEVILIYTRMKNAMESEALAEKLLPLHRFRFEKAQKIASVSAENLAYLPSPEEVLNRIVPNYVAGFIYGALVESYSGEQHARMTAMQSATDNADAMLRNLSMEYNRVRQSAITQEITEVAAGERAMKEVRI